MALYLSFDGGGTKLNGMLFDDQMNLIATARSGGINLTQTSMEDCRANIADALDQLFAGGVPQTIDVMYYTGVGHFQTLCEMAGARTHVTQYVSQDEARGGLMAGSLRTRGIVALAGTGSDLFYISPAKRAVVGAWGPILGDDGSGVWIGQQAIRAIVRYLNDWGDKTVMLDLIREEWQLKNDWQMVEIVHGSPAPLRKVGTLTRLVGRAANMGDAVALGILREAGHLMAVQTESLIRRAELGEDELDITLCGGAWKAHPAMFETFKAELTANHPALKAHRPLFEHVMCGPAKLLIDSGMPREEAITLLKERFAAYLVEGGSAD